MIRGLVDFALNNRFMILAAAILLFIWGAISFHNLPVEAYPDVANNYVTIITQWLATVRALLPWPLQRRLDAEAPTHFAAPTGSQVPIDYEAEGGPKIAIRVQELFGLDRHPAIAGGKAPLLIELLSPAHRPVQMTRDLPGFWRGSYAAVRAEMRGRYPKHPWPEDPIAAPPTRRAKPRNR